MLRLTGLPNVASFPRATVQRRPDRFELVFHGGGHSQAIDVPFRYIGPMDDLEGAELDLLARLQQIGYEVERKPPEDEPGA